MLWSTLAFSSPLPLRNLNFWRLVHWNSWPMEPKLCSHAPPKYWFHPQFVFVKGNISPCDSPVYPFFWAICPQWQLNACELPRRMLKLQIEWCKLHLQTEWIQSEYILIRKGVAWSCNFLFFLLNQGQSSGEGKKNSNFKSGAHWSQGHLAGLFLWYIPI